MVPYITVRDVVERTGAPLTMPDTVVERWIAVAHVKLRSLDPTLDARVENGTLGQAVLQDVLVEAVWRHVQDQLIGWRVRSETWPENTTMYKDAENLGIYFRDDELALLDIHPLPDTQSGVWGFSRTIRPSV